MRMWVSLVVAGLLLASGSGCMHMDPYTGPGPAGMNGFPPGTNIPPTGTIPRELEKIPLPPYVIEAPDQLLINVITVTEEEDPETPAVPGKAKPKKMVTRPLPVQEVTGAFNVHVDGTVYLGVYGQVSVSGMTKEQAANAIRQHISKQPILTLPGAAGIKPETIYVILDVIQYNSKKYYVITDGGGSGEQVFTFPIVGGETVLDALSYTSGLPPVASKNNIWIARRTPHIGQTDQILPVDWHGLTQLGQTATNYQIMPGDRIYVKALPLVTLDTNLARILSPIERMFGVSLLGTNTYNQIRGRGTGF
ncbi:MAG: polysaccharide biosynthesis/export family protein [Gemmataceae bacterium]